ncbi:hypothetical protein Mal52_13460 [Symmachiella dynata]|uniref:HNH nuclease domain-containing protein n=1 Tax=Symmachiella dynata TaxID=2527995 RepID=A0A517ZK92_9PLAN|nr:HNH endonuclease signature motif containing protein [Symmachiella dynata]QDU42877.1 hypothetical protein Mal52_13460 [Symmachiella dynata]
MSKYDFNNAETYAIWLLHDKRCWICLEPLRLGECSVDHVIPESLLDSVDDLANVLQQYGLPNDFRINWFGNWLPSHVRCNQTKSNKIFEYVPGLKLILDRLAKKAEAVAKSARSISANVEKDKVFAKVFVALEKETISLDDLQEVFCELRHIDDVDTVVLEEEISIHFDPDRWTIASEGSGYVVVTDGRLGGIVPSGPSPHISWMCPTCRSYGPWNGVRCMSCGHMSDPHG